MLTILSDRQTIKALLKGVLIAALILTSVSALAHSNAVHAKYYWVQSGNISPHIMQPLSSEGEFSTAQAAVSDVISRAELAYDAYWNINGITGYSFEFDVHETWFTNYSMQVGISSDRYFDGNYRSPSITFSVNPICDGGGTGGIYCSCPIDEIPVRGKCEKERRCKPDKEDTIGNPCKVATGEKLQSESLNLNSALDFSWSYNSQQLGANIMGSGWTTPYHKGISNLPPGHNKIGIVRGNTVEIWIPSGGWGTNWVAPNYSNYQLEQTATDFKLTLNDGTVETYSLTGQLLTVTDTKNNITSYFYDSDNFLTQVTNQFGHSLYFEHTETGQISAVTDMTGARYLFDYDSNTNLISVTYPDTTADETDNPVRHYHYENATFPNHLTGITDENGDRFATYAYDANGRAISTEHAQTTGAVGQEKFELDFQGQ